ncbi:L-Ala-D/L-Glu epimerase [Microbulbifer sp. OS29]|uniref:Dipeptide epimerase n=1 Tax=Microbulbifer okhotskensis TaxID=2926617 RepID=A0A9X2ESG2_9GAMM|nr:L-Ala-D/L-Glu epimerase [Microbulbifer okhotskensis]MCO1334928.1 L-Ala-D/L-Glu epimerase [Microbulbifer okhotskensis]
MQARCYDERWSLRTAFVISRGARTEVRVVVVEVSGDGVTGIGECTPYARYGESVASVLHQLQPSLQEVADGLTCEQLQAHMPAGAARNALDCALSDWEMKAQGALHPGPISLPTVQTLVVDSPDAMAVAARVAVEAGVDLLKLKLDDQHVRARVSAVRAAAPNAQLIIDANEAWHTATLIERCEDLSRMGVSMLEQPLPASEDGFLETFEHPLPICADESCHTRNDLPQLVHRYEMINIKLDKTGGITEALALADKATALGLEWMLGCMLCTSRAIRAAWPLGSRARYLDLDGPTWLVKDTEPPLRFKAGRVYWS